MRRIARVVLWQLGRGKKGNYSQLELDISALSLSLCLSLFLRPLRAVHYS